MPCGTPAPGVTGDSENDYILGATLQEICDPAESRIMIPQQTTLSKAFEKSRRMASIWLELSTLLAISLTVNISCVTQKSCRQTEVTQSFPQKGGGHSGQE